MGSRRLRPSRIGKLAAAVVFAGFLGLNLVALVSRTRLAPTLGFSPLLASVGPKVWIFLDLVLLELACASLSIEKIVRRARRTPLVRPTTASRLRAGPVLAALVAVSALLAIEAPTDGAPSLQGERANERHAYPSLLASLWTGDFLYEADACGGLFGIAKVVTREMRHLRAPHWFPQIGAGRPLYPVDYYDYGTYDPLEYGAVLLAPDTNRYFVWSSVLHVLLIALGVAALLGGSCRHPISIAIATLLLFGSHFLNWYPNYTQVYQMPIAGVLLLAAALQRLVERGGILWLCASALVAGWLCLNVVVCVPACGMTALGAVVAGGISRGSARREWLDRSARVGAALALGAAISLAHVLPLRLFAAECTNRYLPYIGQGMDLGAGLRDFGHWFAAGPVSWTLATLGLLAGCATRRRGFAFWLACSLGVIAALGFVGAYDRLSLLVGYNSQHVNTFAPTATVSGLIFMALGADALLSPGRSPAAHASCWVLGLLILHLLRTGGAAVPEVPLTLAAPPLLLLLPGAGREGAPERASAGWTIPAFVAFAAGVGLVSSRNSVLNAYLTGARPPAVAPVVGSVSLIALTLAVHLVGVALATRRPPRRARRAFATARELAMLFALVAVTFSFESLSQRDSYLVSSSIDHPRIEPAFERVIAAAEPDHRLTCLFPRDGVFPATFDYVAADAIPMYHLHAPLYGYHEATGSMSLTVARYSDFVDYANYGCAWGSAGAPAERIRKTDPVLYGRLAQIKRINLIALDVASPLWKYAALKYVISQTALEGERLKLVETVMRPITYGRHMEPKARLDRVYIYELLDAYPRVYVPETVKIVPRPSEDDVRALEKTAGASRFAVIADPDRAPGIVPGAGSATLVRETCEALELDVTLSSEGYVVVSDTFFPGWRARVDDQDAPVLCANYAFRAVRVGAGAHRVVMTFEPAAIRRGFAVGAAAFALCVVGLIYAAIQERRRRDPQ